MIDQLPTDSVGFFSTSVHSAAVPLYGAAQVRELDRRAIFSHGIPGYTLMQRAAAATWAAACRRWPAIRETWIVCGSGNNGGDGYEIARLARAAGWQVRVIQVGPPPAKGDGAKAYAAWCGEGGPVERVMVDDVPRSLAFPPIRVGTDPGIVLFDAVFGTGLDRPLSGLGLAAVEAINRCGAAGAKVVAVDIPSGLSTDDGKVLGAAVRADLTVSFIGRKLGVYAGAGPDLCGECEFDDLGVPAAVYAGLEPFAGLLQPELIRRALPPRARESHKGSNGHVLIIGGAPGTAGAVLLAGRAALRSGAGLVSIATHCEHAAHIMAAQPELMVLGLDENEVVQQAGATWERLAQQIAAASVIAIGPGLGQGPWGQALWQAAQRSGKPLIVDADALNLLASIPRMRGVQGFESEFGADQPLPNWILTPHPGEAARLLDSMPPDLRSNTPLQSDRIGAVKALRYYYTGVVVLKGAGTLISSSVPDAGSLALCPFGNPGMGVGGMGDVLTGVIAALLAQILGLHPQTPLKDAMSMAAQTGVLVHALAGDRTVQQAGMRGLLPSDLITELRSVVNGRI